MSFAKFGEFLIIIGIIFQAYPLLSLLWYLYAMNVRSFVIVSQALEGLFVVVFVFFSIISYSSSDQINSIVLSSPSLIPSSLSYILLLSPTIVFLNVGYCTLQR